MSSYFEAEGILFHQLWGLAMGTPMAVSAATIYKASLERSLLQHTRGLLFYTERFIDDIFFHRLNNLAPIIKLTWEVSDQKVNFLDVLVFKDPEDHTKLITKPYQKPLNRYLHIPFISYHLLLKCHTNLVRNTCLKAKLIPVIGVCLTFS